MQKTTLYEYHFYIFFKIYFHIFLCFSFVVQVKAATGEVVSAEDLGGADLHCKYESFFFFLQ